MTLTNFIYTSCFDSFIYTSHNINFVYTSHNIDKIVYKSHQRPRGGERLAGRYIAEEQLRRRLRLGHLEVRGRLVGASREGCWRSGRRGAAGSGRVAST